MKLKRDARPLLKKLPGRKLSARDSKKRLAELRQVLKCRRYKRPLVRRNLKKKMKLLRLKL